MELLPFVLIGLLVGIIFWRIQVRAEGPKENTPAPQYLNKNHRLYEDKE